MNDTKHSKRSSVSRRQLLHRALALPLTLSAWSSLFKPHQTEAQVSIQTSAVSSKTLVAYFTRSGNTRVIANQLQRDLKADLFQIEPATPYPADYEANVAEAQREKESGALRPLKNQVPQWNQYERIFLGFPIWGTTAPAIIRPFLTEHDTRDKVLIPFITHGKYGLGNSLSVVREHAKHAKLLKGYSEECDQERDTMESVDKWLKKLG